MGCAIRYLERKGFDLSDVPDFSKGNGLLPVVVQDASSREVLMLAYMNRAAWEAMLADGEAVYYSRKRGRLWKKGEESGHVQRVCEVYVDCDADTILLRVEQAGGAACHKGYATCFFRRLVDGSFETVGEKVFDPQRVYSKAASAAGESEGTSN